MIALCTQIEKELNIGIGGKAKNLLQLEKINARVPKWAVIPQDVLMKQLPQQTDMSDIQLAFDQLVVPQSLSQQLAEFFGEGAKNKTYAVRSSAIDEDGAQFSFAGQFETFLHVSFNQIEEKVKAIWQSVISERVISYRESNNMEMQYGIAVIIQEMIDAEVAGVAFGANPVSGDPKGKVISSVYGLGEGLVSGELDADTYSFDPNGNKENIANKTHAFKRSQSGIGIEKIEVEASMRKASSLDKNQLKEIGILLDNLNQELGSPQDIEFAYSNHQLFLLQTRPITTISNQPKGEYTVWDNSNIVESYPGVTTPLTFSFILKMYEMVYRQFSSIMGVDQKQIDANTEVYENTLGLVKGRVYYNLLNWYKMLAMLPGYSINAENMERMMGVKESFDLGDQFKMSKTTARFRIFKMVVKMIGMQIALPRERRKFMKQLNQDITRFNQIDLDALTTKEIIELYKGFESSLLLKWKAPLVNDFFAMIWFGMLEKNAKKICPNEPNIHNDLLCGSQDIISVEPIHRSLEISTFILQDSELKGLFIEENPAEIWSVLNLGKHRELKAKIDAYILKFGDRCVGELKLETISYSQDPTLFIKVIKSYVTQGITKKKQASNIENDLRDAATIKINKGLKNKALKKWWFSFVLKRTRDLVSNRENLRYERTRAFGMVRNMMTAIGKKWQEQGLIENAKDVFFLELEEIKSQKTEGLTTELTQKIKERKIEFNTYHQEEAPQERFFSYGNDFQDSYIYSAEKVEGVIEDLKGIGCCPGIVRAKVQIVKNPNDIDSLNGDILVTSSTDPGWVTLFPTASAIVVERGSLLSHSAIVSREMGIPCIVSVDGLLRSLKSGDEVWMDGSTGEIKKIA
jgi:pyruvate,water dikinase